MSGSRGVKLEVGAFYTTTDPFQKVVRVISTRVRDLSRDMLEVGAPKGYWLQVVDGTYHSPFTTDRFGCWEGKDGHKQMVLDKVAPALEKYTTQGA